MRAAFVAPDVSDRSVRALNYTPEVDAFRRRVVKGGGALLSEMVTEFGRAYRKAFIRVDARPGHGEAFLSQGDTFAAEPEGRTISLDYLGDPAAYRIRKWEVLIAGAGTLAETELYGRCVIADERLVGKLMCEDTFSLTFAQPGSDPALFTYAFLCSRVGLRVLRAMSYGTKILRLRRDLLHNLPIPLPDTATQKRVGDLIRLTVAERERYLRELAAARACIEGLPEMREATEMSRERKARALVWRGELPTLTGWTYASAGETLALLQRKWSGRLGDVVLPEDIFNGPRFARVDCRPPHGMSFLAQRDLFLIRPIPRRIMNPGFGDRLLFTHPRSILIGGHGTLGEGEIFGRSVFVSDDLAHHALTQDMLRVWPDEASAEVLYAFLSTLVGFRLIRATAVGTKILSLRTDLLRALPIPDLTPDLHARVTAHVRAAMTARAAATAAEREAVRIVEEEVLPQWLA